MYTEESLEKLRHSIDIVEVISEHIHLKRRGSTYKACCPFHQEKTPSFVVNASDGHYHCFGCGAHGDGIQFIKEYLGLPFGEAVLTLSKKFNVKLEVQLQDPQLSGSAGAKENMRRINAEAERFFQFCLHYLPEGREALKYLFRRALSFDTITRFHLGYAPERKVFVKAMQDLGISEQQLKESGFILNDWFLFSRRIIFPIHDSLGYTIGFSSRTFQENARGSKYVNTPETVVFKKSRALFGSHLSRKRIAKEKRVILVEGQVDCLQMIDSGFNCTLAAQGTAFTEDHVKELKKLGVAKAYLLFDGDEAGIKAALRVGDMCLRAGITAYVCRLQKGLDPDTFLIRQGAIELGTLLDQSEDFLTFLVTEKMRNRPRLSPHEKALITEETIMQIHKWGTSIYVYEYLKQLASLMDVPEKMVLSLADKKGLSKAKEEHKGKASTKKVDIEKVSLNMIMETDILRCMIFCKPEHISIPHTAKHYFSSDDFLHPECKKLFVHLISYYEKHRKNMALEEAISVLSDQSVIDILLYRRINMENIEDVFVQALQKLSDCHWKSRCVASENKRPEIDNLSSLANYVRLRKDRVKISILRP